MRALVLLACVMLAGCTTTRYVPVKCITAEQYKQFEQAEPPKVSDQLTGNAEQDIKPIAGSAVRLRAWGKGMLGVLGGCVG